MTPADTTAPGRPPLALPKDCVFCPGCLRLMPRFVWDSMITREIPCNSWPRMRCPVLIEEYSAEADLYQRLRDSLFPA
jgi:hypothetical protein